MFTFNEPDQMKSNGFNGASDSFFLTMSEDNLDPSSGWASTGDSDAKCKAATYCSGSCAQ